MHLSILFAVVFAAVAAAAPAPAQTTEGEKIYADRCVSCHARDGSGNTARGKTLKVPDLRSVEIQKKTDDQLLQAVVAAKAHPAYRKQIGDDGIRKVIGFMRSLKRN